MSSATYNYKLYWYMIFNLVWLQARQTGSSIKTKVLLRVMLIDTTVHQEILVKQALSANPLPSCETEDKEITCTGTSFLSTVRSSTLSAANGSHLVRNPGMVPNETICGVRRFHRVVFQRCVRCPPILHESFKKLE